MKWLRCHGSNSRSGCGFGCRSRKVPGQEMREVLHREGAVDAVYASAELCDVRVVRGIQVHIPLTTLEGDAPHEVQLYMVFRGRAGKARVAIIQELTGGETTQVRPDQVGLIRLVVLVGRETYVVHVVAEGDVGGLHDATGVRGGLLPS